LARSGVRRFNTEIRAQAIKKIADLGWKTGAHPRHQRHVSGRRDEAGRLENSRDVISVNYGRIRSSDLKDDAGMKKYFAFMARYFPQGERNPAPIPMAT